ncbi:MAG: hypothetical protein JKY23_05380 [Nitrospinaceae bacterium]|nr:hypothetical protein [Nitrospinaceae bacterium]
MKHTIKLNLTDFMTGGISDVKLDFVTYIPRVGEFVDIEKLLTPKEEKRLSEIGGWYKVQTVEHEFIKEADKTITQVIKICLIEDEKYKENYKN